MTLSNFISENYYTISELSSLLGVSRVAVQYKIHKGCFEFERFGRLMLVPKKSFLAYVNAKEVLNEPLRRGVGKRKESVE
jgi:excisionase family DNA binding protein